MWVVVIHASTGRLSQVVSQVCRKLRRKFVARSHLLAQTVPQLIGGAFSPNNSLPHQSGEIALQGAPVQCWETILHILDGKLALLENEMHGRCLPVV